MNYVKPRLEAPSFAFDPTDPWTETFQIGLWRAGLQGRHVYEVGIGTGTNAVFCSTSAMSPRHLVAILTHGLLCSRSEMSQS